MVKLNNDLWELLKSHISVYEDLQNSRCRTEQLDFLAFRVDKEAMSKNSPFKYGNMWTRDNPNWELTKYENVYQLVEEDKIVLQYVKDWYSPVAILQWYKVKLPKIWEKRKISVYWKWLRLYYCGLIDWLAWYITMYADTVIRADLCWDHKEKIPTACIDLPNTVTYWELENRTYKWFGNKRSPLFIRIYDKTLDLANDHNSMAWLYPEWYTTSCWRLECKFTWRYASSMSAWEWLWTVECNWSVQKIKNPKRDYLKSTFYNLLMYIDYIPDRTKQYELLEWINKMCSSKLKKLKPFISVNDCEND